MKFINACKQPNKHCTNQKSQSLPINGLTLYVPDEKSKESFTYSHKLLTLGKSLKCKKRNKNWKWSIKRNGKNCENENHLSKSCGMLDSQNGKLDSENSAPTSAPAKPCASSAAQTSNDELPCSSQNALESQSKVGTGVPSDSSSSKMKPGSDFYSNCFPDILDREVSLGVTNRRIIEPGKFIFTILQRHVSMNAKGKKIFKCDVCSDTYYLRAFSLKRHYLREHINFKHICDRDISNCNILLGEKTSLKGRKRKTKGNLDQGSVQLLEDKTAIQEAREAGFYVTPFGEVLCGVFQCNVCYNVYNTLKELRQHASSHSTAGTTPPRTYFCESCRCSFADQPSLVKHMTANHSPNNILECEVCHLDFTNEEAFQNHLKLHLTADSEESNCNYPKVLDPLDSVDQLCDSSSLLETTPQSGGTKVKEEVAPNNETDSSSEKKKGSFFCDVCDKVFIYRANFVKHQQSSHRDFSEKHEKHICSVCHLEFACSRALKDHEVTHGPVLTCKYIKENGDVHPQENCSDEEDIQHHNLHQSQVPNSKNGNLCVEDEGCSDTSKEEFCLLKWEESSGSGETNDASETIESSNIENTSEDTASEGILIKTCDSGLFPEEDKENYNAETDSCLVEMECIKKDAAHDKHREKKTLPCVSKKEGSVRKNCCKVNEISEEEFYKSLCARISPNILENLGCYLEGKIDGQHDECGYQLENSQEPITKMSWLDFEFPPGVYVRLEEIFKLDFGMQNQLHKTLERLCVTRGSSDGICEKKENEQSNLLEELALKRVPSHGKQSKMKKCRKKRRVRENHNSRDTTLSGDWSRAHIYVCSACSAKFADIWDLWDHKYNVHPNVHCTHVEFEGNNIKVVPNELTVKFSDCQGLARKCTLFKTVGSGTQKCTKCDQSFSSGSDLHQHILDCSGDLNWANPPSFKKAQCKTFDKRRKRSRSRGMKRNIPNTPEQPRKFRRCRSLTDGSDTIERMIANLPPKRISRKILPNASPVKKLLTTRESSKVSRSVPLTNLLHEYQAANKRDPPIRVIIRKGKVFTENQLLKGKCKVLSPITEISDNQSSQDHTMKALTGSESARSNLSVANPNKTSEQNSLRKRKSDSIVVQSSVVPSKKPKNTCLPDALNTSSLSFDHKVIVEEHIKKGNLHCDKEKNPESLNHQCVTCQRDFDCLVQFLKHKESCTSTRSLLIERESSCKEGLLSNVVQKNLSQKVSVTESSTRVSGLGNSNAKPEETQQKPPKKNTRRLPSSLACYRRHKKKRGKMVVRNKIQNQKEVKSPKTKVSSEVTLHSNNMEDLPTKETLLNTQSNPPANSVFQKVCPTCKRRFAYWANLRKHIASCNPDMEMKDESRDSDSAKREFIDVTVDAASDAFPFDTNEKCRNSSAGDEMCAPVKRDIKDDLAFIVKTQQHLTFVSQKLKDKARKLETGNMREDLESVIAELDRIQCDDKWNNTVSLMQQLLKNHLNTSEFNTKFVEEDETSNLTNEHCGMLPPSSAVRYPQNFWQGPWLEEEEFSCELSSWLLRNLSDFKNRVHHIIHNILENQQLTTNFEGRPTTHHLSTMLSSSTKLPPTLQCLSDKSVMDLTKAGLNILLNSINRAVQVALDRQPKDTSVTECLEPKWEHDCSKQCPHSPVQHDDVKSDTLHRKLATVSATTNACRHSSTSSSSNSVQPVEWTGSASLENSASAYQNIKQCQDALGVRYPTCADDKHFQTKISSFSNFGELFESNAPKRHKQQHATNPRTVVSKAHKNILKLEAAKMDTITDTEKESLPIQKATNRCCLCTSILPKQDLEQHVALCHLAHTVSCHSLPFPKMDCVSEEVCKRSFSTSALCLKSLINKLIPNLTQHSVVPSICHSEEKKVASGQATQSCQQIAKSRSNLARNKVSMVILESLMQIQELASFLCIQIAQDMYAQHVEQAATMLATHQQIQLTQNNLQRIGSLCRTVELLCNPGSAPTYDHAASSDNNAEVREVLQEILEGFT